MSNWGTACAKTFRRRCASCAAKGTACANKTFRRRCASVLKEEEISQGV